MRILILALVLAGTAAAQCPNGNCPTVRVTVTMPAPPPPRYAVPVFLATPVVYAVPVRTPWYPTKWLRGRRGQ
jgi:hypothetical protein